MTSLTNQSESKTSIQQKSERASNVLPENLKRSLGIILEGVGQILNRDCLFRKEKKNS